MNEDTQKIHPNKEKNKTTIMFIQGNIEDKLYLFAEAVEKVFRDKNYGSISAQIKTNQENYKLIFTAGNVARRFEKIFEDNPLSEIEINILGDNSKDITAKIMKTYKPHKKTGKLVFKSKIEKTDYNS